MIDTTKATNTNTYTNDSSSLTASANAIRFLAADAVQQANSGHPGMPMGMADIATVLWQTFLSHNPNNPHWMNRDRFILSNGHGSMLHYALLHLSGYDLSIQELQNFRQMHSKTPGHPEYFETPGIETTTGPLGQGIANAVGMALSEQLLAQKYNRPNHKIIDHHTYVFAGDGCLMEGISHEASSLAGTLKLGKLIMFWDDNKISIDGDTKGWFTENVADRYRAYHWQVIEGIDGHDFEDIHQAIKQAHHNTTQPTLICCKTNIGFGSPNKSGTASVHGAPLGDTEVQLMRTHLNWPHTPFKIPQSIYGNWDARPSGAEREKKWQAMFAQYTQQHPELASELMRVNTHTLPKNFQEIFATLNQHLNQSQPKVATRKSSQLVLEAISPSLPELLGGSADLTGSNNTDWSGSVWLNHPIPTQAQTPNYISYGVREFGMAAIMNGLYLHGGFRPYGGTFLVFSDYARNAIRMSALMKIPVIYVMTHDSIGLGEDGPTHQPIEHLASLRLIPNLNVFRPADAFECSVAWQQSLTSSKTPSILALSRQNLPFYERDSQTQSNVFKGGYLLSTPSSSSTKASVSLLATGSEVALIQAAATHLSEEGIHLNVISMPCVEIFNTQSQDYQEHVIQPDIPLIIVEAGVTNAWHTLLVGKPDGEVLGLDHFGASAPAEALFEEFGLTINNIIKTVRKYL